MELDRRTLIAGGVALTGLVIAIRWSGAARSPLGPAREGELIAGSYLRVGSDGRVTLAVPQCETGQGIWTGLAQVAADELGADWAMVALEPAPLDPAYANPLAEQVAGRAMRLTAGASSIRVFEAPVREAAAEARARLIRAAAEEWGIDEGMCDSRDGFVVAGSRRLAFGALVARAAQVSAQPRLRDVGSGPLAGREITRLDLLAKATGSWRMAGDVRLPDMVFASARVAPPGGRLTGLDRRAAAAPGIALHESETWVAAVGPTHWAAEQALVRAAVRFSGTAAASSPDIDAALDRALASGKRAMAAEIGDYAAATEGRMPLAATYRAAPASSAGLEPLAAAARWQGSGLEIWASGRAPDLTIEAVAGALGVGAGDILIYPVGAGEPDGAGIDPTAAIIAASLAREAGRPVSLTLPAATSLNQAPLRPPGLAKVAALANPAGGLDSWRITIASAAGLGDFGPDGLSTPYVAGALLAEAIKAKLPPLNLGYVRGGDGVLATFAIESFIDELARTRGVEPLAYRIGLLAGRPRLARALASAARLGGWDGGGRGSSLGLACASAFGSHIGLLAEASLGADQRVAVSRLVAVVDAGRAINPRLVRQQVEGSLLSALAHVTGPAPEIIAGVPRARPLAALGWGSLRAVPKVEVAVIPSREAPGGVSGLGALVLGPALANALFAATGMRLRRLPLDPMVPA